jgi:hypothetical protein
VTTANIETEIIPDMVPKSKIVQMLLQPTIWAMNRVSNDLHDECQRSRQVLYHSPDSEEEKQMPYLHRHDSFEALWNSVRVESELSLLVDSQLLYIFKDHGIAITQWRTQKFRQVTGNTHSEGGNVIDTYTTLQGLIQTLDGV